MVYRQRAGLSRSFSPPVRASFRHISPCTRCFARLPRPRRRRSGARAGPHHMTRREPPTFPSSAAAGAAPPRSPGLASGCPGRTYVRTYDLAGGDDHDAADAGGAAAGFDFGDAARMAAEFAPILGGAPAGQRRHRAHARSHAHARTPTHARAHARTHAHACSHVYSLFASMSRFFALLVPLHSSCLSRPC